MKNMGYYHLVTPGVSANVDMIPKWIKTFNQKSLDRCLLDLAEKKGQIHILINHPKLLMRKKSEKHPEGRTSYRFKVKMRHNCTIIGKSAFKTVEEASEAQEKEKDKSEKPFVASEQNYKETADEADEPTQ